MNGQPSNEENPQPEDVIIFFIEFATAKAEAPTTTGLDAHAHEHARLTMAT